MALKLITYDFGGGYLRTDIEPFGIAIGEHINDKTGEWEKFSFSVQFDFKMIVFLRKLKAFMEKGT